MRSLKDKVAVVTGAASGIGRSLAVELAREGCLLAVCDKEGEGLEETCGIIEAYGHLPEASQLDVSDRKAMQVFAREVSERFSQVDILINNAGVAIGTKKFLEITEEEWQWILDNNLWGVIYGVQVFLPYLQERKESCIVNISSVLGLAGMIHQSAYSTTKFAVRGLSESLRMELAEKGVNVISVHPGAVKTKIIDNAWADDENKALVKSYIEKIGYISAEEAAIQIIQGIKKKKPRVIVGGDAKKTDLMARFMPNRYTRIILSQMRSKLE